LQQINLQRINLPFGLTATGAPSMTHPDIDVVSEEGVSTIRILRPPHNYFDPPLVSGLADAALALSGDGRTRCIVVCSEGRSFCAGAKFGDAPPLVRTGPDGSPEGRGGWRPAHLYEEAARLFDVEVPLVAAVQGAAIGGGLGLALVCDFRVATPRTRFVANFAQLGIHHGFGLSVTLPLVVGHQAAMRMLLAAHEVSGEEAARIGLCDRLVAEDDLMTAATTFAGGIAGLAPLAVRSMKRTLRGRLKAEVLATIDREINEQRWLMRTGDHAEGVAAVGARREPSFQSV
jgi:enoyl-CoA hydratase/carnithine racemase